MGRHEMPGSGGMDADLGLRKTAGEMSRPASMVEVDVGHRHHGQVVDADLVEGFIQVVDRAGGATLDENPVRSVEQVTRQALGLVVHQRIDQVEIVAQSGDDGVDERGR